MATLSGEMSNSSSALMEGTEDAASIDFGDVERGVIRKAPRHRMAAFFHLAFRTTALLTYLLCRLFTDSFVSSFVCILLLLCMDFWTVKNVTGRLLVGLRWWNYVDDAGKSHWVFESRKAGEQTTDASEASLFWMGLIGAPVLWTLFFFVSLFSWNFQWLMVTMIALALNGANLYGYIRCRLGSKGSMKAAASNFFGQQLLRGMFSKKEAAPPARDSGTAQLQP
ncbi:Golgi apparatus membrane protein TVP23 homolog B isoform X1 [Rhipicephalus microplus]|uniref:Golgi apparatus membrane protein TVP23 homolog B isoform X1 n=2 Tax=Rhipicephalus microplus TaxID=6941 RepID=UPI003F6B4FC1